MNKDAIFLIFLFINKYPPFSMQSIIEKPAADSCRYFSDGYQLNYIGKQAYIQTVKPTQVNDFVLHSCCIFPKTNTFCGLNRIKYVA